MATTSLWQVSGAPAAVLKYAANPEKTDSTNSGAAADPKKQIGDVMRYTARDEKTDGRLLVTGVRCSPDSEKAAEEFMQTKRAWGKTGGVTCFHGYLHYMYLLGNLPESRPPSRETYVMMREDSKRLKMYSDESKLLAANRIVTAEDLAGYVASITNKYEELARRRAGLRNKLRHMTDSEAMRPIKDQIAALSDDMAKLRRERKLCEDVAARCEIVEYIADTIEKEHTPQTQDRIHSPRGRNDAR